MGTVFARPNRVNTTFITFAIPTYNRARKLERLLEILEKDLPEELRDKFEVLVSDNASSDDTPRVLSRFAASTLPLRSFRNPENLGFDGNTAKLYREAKGEYVWFFSDDDIPFPHSYLTIFRALQEGRADALLFSFQQPPGSLVKTFNYPQSLQVVMDFSEMILRLVTYPKVSIYIVKRQLLNDAHWDALKPFLGGNYHFITLVFEILVNAQSPRLAIISEQLARSDDDFLKIRFDPETWGRRWTVCQHPLVRRHAPEMGERLRRDDRNSLISILFGYKAGSIEVSDPVAYEKAIKALKWGDGFKISEWRICIYFLTLKMRLVRPSRWLVSMIRRWVWARG
jgi:glycosyltransferase involved in cell wall biosynthesis